MSPLWRDEIGIYLAPHKVALTRLARGLRPRSAGEAAWSRPFPGDTHWAAALDALEGYLSRAEWHNAAVRIVVADSWVRYAMVPYSDDLSGEAERLIHARHVLTGIYGEVVSQWTVTLSEGAPGMPSVACALPSALVEELRLRLERHKLPLKSLQPQLVAAYNHWRSTLPEDLESRPGLLGEIEKSSGATAGIKECQFALIASGECFVQRRQRLPSHGVGCAIEQHLDLRVIALSGIVRHPAAGLEVEILQIIARALAARFFAQHVVVGAALATAMHCREIFEEKSRAMNKGEQSAVMISGQGVNASLDIGEILQK